MFWKAKPSPQAVHTGAALSVAVLAEQLAGKLSQPVLRIVGLWTQIQQVSLSAKRLGDLMNAPVEPGHTVAIMGPSGCGKSTFAKLLLGFYPPTQGSIQLDGIDIRSLSANVQVGNPNATLDEVAHACRLAGVHEVIEQLPQGCQTEIGERGAGLSGGQKQRLAIARALLKRPRILIFDEATSALDAETAEAFATTINLLKGKVTMLFITHAEPKSLRVDAVLRIDQGGAHV